MAESNTHKTVFLQQSAEAAGNLVKLSIIKFPLRSESVLFFFCLRGFQTERSYLATVKLIYTIGYSASLVLLAAAVLILLLFRYRSGPQRQQ